MLNDFILLEGLQKNYLQAVKKFITEWSSDAKEISANTSGSTGQPKLIRISKQAARHSAWCTGMFFELSPGQIALLNLSPEFIAGKMMIVRAYEHNLKLVVAPLTDNPLIALPNIDIDFAAFVPNQIHSILADKLSKAKLNSIKNVIIGGAPLNPQLENELTQMTCKCYVSFGMTETITHFALRRVGTPIYHCLDGFEIDVDDRSCLVIKPNEILDEALITNDVIELQDSYSFKWKGRFDFVINSGGIKIHPEVVEKMIIHLLPDHNYYLTSKSDETYGEIAILMVEGQVDTTQLLHEAKACLPTHYAPKEVYIQAAFDYTETGKIIREKF
jgi:O-succinylbenzoic acid--CoA ligase